MKSFTAHLLFFAIHPRTAAVYPEKRLAARFVTYDTTIKAFKGAQK
jgi:hypothetical protein